MTPQQIAATLTRIAEPHGGYDRSTWITASDADAIRRAAAIVAAWPKMIKQLERIRDADTEIPGLAPGFGGHAVRIAAKALAIAAQAESEQPKET